MIRHNCLGISSNSIKMANSILLTILIISSVYISAEFSDRVRKTSVKIFPLIDLETNGHFVISPLSIFNLMTSISYETSGESRKQIKRAFYLPKNTKICGNGYRDMEEVLTQQSDGVALFSQNFMFIDENMQLNEKYNKKLNKSSIATPRSIVKKLDFTSNEAAIEANDIIEKSTNVSNVLNPSNFIDSKMILTNIISFKGFWTLPFNESDTTVEPFYDENNNEIGKVNMMYQRLPFRSSFIQSLNAHVLELPYGTNSSYCMLVILPYPKVTVREVYQNFESVTYLDIFNQLQSDEDEFGLLETDVKIPRFKISTNVVLNKPLNSMGVTDIFEQGKANFEKITNEDVFVSTIIHKADIEVTESGTVATASTSAYLSDRMATPDFIASRPFIYMIMDNRTKTVIFMGIYSQPSLF